MKNLPRLLVCLSLGIQSGVCMWTWRQVVCVASGSSVVAARASLPPVCQKHDAASCCVFCLAAWKALHRTADKLRTLMMGEQRAESSFDSLPVLGWGCWFTGVGPSFHEDSKKSQLIEGAVGTLLKRALEWFGKADKGMENWCSFFTELETCYKNIWSSWTPHLYGFCQKRNALVNSVRAQLSQQR